MSLLGDAQEFPAIVLTELHIEMLALNLQFFRLDDVIHFPGGATLSQPICAMEAKSAGSKQISEPPRPRPRPDGRTDNRSQTKTVFTVEDAKRTEYFVE